MDNWEAETLNISGIVDDSIVDGPGLRYTIFVQGCPHGCPECHNPQTHSFEENKRVTLGQLMSEIKENPLLYGVTFSGGEPFLFFFLAFVIRTLLKDGFAVDAQTQEIVMEPYKYFNNLVEMPYLLLLFVLGVAGVLWGLIKSILCTSYTRGIWFAGVGTVLTVLALLLTVGYNHTAYYPSTADLQSSLTLANSCSSMFTLKTMAYVSILVPFVLAYIVYAWRAIDRKPITAEELKEDDHAY